MNGASAQVSNFLVSNHATTFTPDSDGFGNVASEKDIRSGATKYYTYRADGKLTSFKEKVPHSIYGNNATVQSVDYIYDPLGRRLVKAINSGQTTFFHSYLYLGDQDKILIGQTAVPGEPNNGGYTLYMDGQGIDDHLGAVTSHSVTGYMTDHLGSVLNTGLTNSYHTYGPFGEPLTAHAGLSLSSDPAQYGYAGRSYDLESHKYYNRARMYNSVIGRFMSKDLLGLGGGDLNLYRYVENNSLLYVDPTGMWCSFSQSSGQLICYNGPSSNPYINDPKGYAGAGVGKNNPSMQNIANVGPIPQGTYTVGNNVPLTPNGLKNALPLIPDQNTDTLGRGGFFIHGNNPNNPSGTSSHGCPVFDRDTRLNIPSGESFIVTH